jgi:steroid 5-alpha reductase family enzyme
MTRYRRSVLTFVITLLLTLAIMTVLWRVAVARHNVSLIDIYWGPGFAVIAWVAVARESAPSAVIVVLALLVSLWGARLGIHLWTRNRNLPEDPRYAAMRQNYPGDEDFERASLVKIFYLQGTLMWLISLPVQIAVVTGIESTGPLAVLGLLVFVVGLLFETVGDYQLARFKRDPSNQGKVLDSGLWRLTRHPNYFGDACVWWGIFLIAAEAPAARWAVFAPLLMNYLLLQVSGKKLLEDNLRLSKPGYAEYIEKTSPFLPRPPRD